jgi:predicted MFS family arabinose efflux permease
MESTATESILRRRGRRYEFEAVTLLALGFGLVGLDRFMIIPMFPAIAKDLHLGYQDIGVITGVLSIAWGIAAFFAGSISDRLGRRKVVIATTLIFSMLVGISGLASSLFTLLIVRACMGFADGAYTAPAITATLEASMPMRRGLNIGIQQMMAPLCGLAFAPLIVTQLLQNVSWRWIFLMVTPLGLVIVALMWFVLRPSSQLAAFENDLVLDVASPKWTHLFRHRNVIHNIVGMLCWISCLMVTSALLPNYLLDYLHLNLQQMGFVVSAIGFGGSAGSVIMPMISDRVGRKPVMIASSIGAAVSLVFFINAGASPAILFAFLFATHFFNFALITLTVGPISGESVPVAMMSAASGLVICIGELFGGGAMPVIAGFIAQNYGIQSTLPLAVVALVIGCANSCLLRETAPVRRHGDHAHGARPH